MTTEVQTQADNHPKPKRRRSWVGWTALIAILIALTCWFQLVHQQKKSTKNYSQLQSSFHQTLSDTAQLSQTISNLQAQITAQSQQTQALQAAFNRLQAVNSGYETDIALQQTDHYLLQANLSLTFNHNIPDAVTLLQAADQRLNSLSEPQAIPLRQKIAATIVKLQAITPIDYVGMLSKLSALRDQTASIPLFAINSKTQIFRNTSPAEAQPSSKITWKGTWQETLETLRSLVIIRDRHTEITPLISQTQEDFLRQNLQLILQQTQWAVLQHNQAVYQFSLTQASEWIQRYFSDNDQATIALQSNISQLLKINLAPQTPDINPLIDQLHNLQLQINKNRTLSNDQITATTKITNEETEEDATEPEAAAPPPATAAKPVKAQESKGELV